MQPARTSTADVDDLLSARLSSTPPPPVVSPPAPSAASPIPKPLPPPPKNDVTRPSYPSASMRGVDELLQDFMSTTSRKEARVAQDLRNMTGVEVGARAPGSA